MKQRSLSVKFQAPKPQDVEKKRLNFVKEKLKGFHVKKVFTYGELIQQKILLTIDFQEKDNLTFEVIYYPNSQAFLIEPLNLGKSIQKETIIATLNELVECKKSGAEEVTIDIQGKTFCSFHCGNFCIFLRDCFLGIICPKCNVKFNSKCNNCGGKGLIPQEMQPCFKCKATGIFPKGSKTSCNLCKAKGYIDPTWNMCTSCAGLGSRKENDKGGSFVYPCSSCNSLGFKIGKKVDAETSAKILRGEPLEKKEEKIEEKKEEKKEEKVEEKKEEKNVLSVVEVPVEIKEEKVNVEVNVEEPKSEPPKEEPKPEEPKVEEKDPEPPKETPNEEVKEEQKEAQKETPNEEKAPESQQPTSEEKDVENWLKEEEVKPKIEEPKQEEVKSEEKGPEPPKEENQ